MDMRFRPSRKNPSGRPWRRPINRPVKTLDPKKWKCALNHSFRMSAFSSPNPLYGLSQRPSSQGWLFHPKMPYTGNQDDFPAATGVHPNRFQHAFIQTQSMGASPLYPQTMFCIHARVLASMQASCSRSNFSQAKGLRRRRPRMGLFPLSAETHGTSRRDMRKCASTIFDERLPFRWLGIGRLCFAVDVCDLRRDTDFRICWFSVSRSLAAPGCESEKWDEKKQKNVRHENRKRRTG